MKKLILAFTTVALAVASAANYHVTLTQPSVINGKQLKPGDYKVQVEGDKAVFSHGKESVEAPVKVEEATQKNENNSVRYADGNKVQEIRIGGKHTRLVFDGGASDTPAVAR